MKIGIISDTHNNIELANRAIGIFKEHEIDLVIHAGDISSPKIIELFKDFDCKFVLGNSDIDVEELKKKVEELGFGDIDTISEFEAGGKTFIVFHGNDVPLFREAVASGKYNYIIKGHTHLFENYISNKSRIINPGCLYGADECSVAVLDTENDKVSLIRIEEE